MSENRYAIINAFYILQLEEFHMDVHEHKRCEIMYVANGSCLVELNGQLTVLGERHFVFIDQNVPHRLIVEENVPCTVLNLEFSCSPNQSGTDLHYIKKRSSSFRNFLSKPQKYQLFFDNYNMLDCLKSLIDTLEKKHLDNQFLIELLFSQFFVLLSYCMQEGKRQDGIHYTKKAKEYIDEHYLEDISADLIANHVGINRSYLHTLFSKYENCSITNYINNLRVERAAFLLKNTSMSVTDIAFSTGFNSRQHFGYTFKKYFQRSPLQYRKLPGIYIKANTSSFTQHKSL